MSNELKDFIETHSRPDDYEDKVLMLELSLSNDASVEQVSALENHLFYHLKEFQKKVNDEGNLNHEVSFHVRPLDRFLSGEDYVIVPK
tara:strand:- start:21 stop:284 length:264 start_codon:yes stop_codon:yes gene_type:complete